MQNIFIPFLVLLFFISFAFSFNVPLLNKEKIASLRKNKCLTSVPLSKSIHDYEILFRLGSGTYGDVFLVNYTQTSCNYAMKLYKKQSDDFDREIYFGDLLFKQDIEFFIHPLQILNITDSSVYYHGLIYEWMPYPIQYFFKISNVKTRLSEIFPMIVLDLFKGLKELHAQEICHFDIKPANILIDALFDQDGKPYYLKVKYIDLGMMSYLFPDKYGIARSRRNGRLGTSIYKAPELLLQPSKANLTTAVDIWSLGQTLLSILNSGPIFGPLIKSNRTDLIPVLMFRLFTPINTFSNSFDNSSMFELEKRTHPDRSWKGIEADSTYLELVENYSQFCHDLQFDISTSTRYQYQYLIKHMHSLAILIQNTFGLEMFHIIKGLLRVNPKSRLEARHAFQRLSTLMDTDNLNTLT